MSTTNGYYPSPIKTRLSENEPIPKGWKWVDLQDVARLESGHTPSRRVPEYWEYGNVPWLSLKDIRGMTSRYVMDTIDKPTMLGIDNSSARILPKGTVAFCRTASVGNVVILGRDMATSQDFVDWVCGPNLLPEFLYEAFKASGPTFANEMQGSTHKTIYMPTVERFKLLLPPLSEQKRIADILDKADAIHRKRQESIAHFGTLTESLFNEMFSHRLPSRRWFDLSNYLEELRYGTSSKSGNGGYVTLRIPNIVRGIIDLGDLKTVEVSESEFQKLRLVDGDVLFVRTNGNPDYVGRCAIFEPSQMKAAGLNADEVIYASYLIRARLKLNRLRPVFLQSLLQTSAGRRNVRDKCRTSAGQYNINTKGIGALQIPDVDIDEQLDFEKRVASLRPVLASLTRAQAEAGDLSSALIQRAFKGEL